MKWKPIDTAPKTGKNFIAYTTQGEMLFTAHWNTKEGRWFTDYELHRGRMTHWMPLPKPPTASPRKEGTS